MGRKQKLIIRILRGTSDANIDFDELCWLLLALGFEQRIRGSHHIFTKDGFDDIINLQPKGAKAKSIK